MPPPRILTSMPPSPSSLIISFPSQREKNLAVSYLHQRLKYLTEKLNPLWTARDEAKGRIGEEKWTTNPGTSSDLLVLICG